MGLFLPVLLLGLAQPASDLPVANSPQQIVSSADASTGSTSASRKFSFDGAKLRQDQPFDHIQVTGDPDGRSTVCLKMRSYYFEQHDGLAPEYVGMTTCDRGPGRILKKINRRPAQLVPAN